MLTSGILYVLNATSAFSLVPKRLEEAALAWGKKGAEQPARYEDTSDINIMNTVDNLRSRHPPVCSVGSK